MRPKLDWCKADGTSDIGSLFAAGLLTDRIGARKTFLIMIGTVCVSAVLFALFSNGFWSGLALYSLAGAASGGSYTPVLALIAQRLRSGETRQRDGLVSRGGFVWLRGFPNRLRRAGAVDGMARQLALSAIAHRWHGARIDRAARTRDTLPHAPPFCHGLIGATACAKQTRAAGDLVVFVSRFGTARHVAVASGLSWSRRLPTAVTCQPVR